jgi:hypothetical protein
MRYYIKLFILLLALPATIIAQDSILVRSNYSGRPVAQLFDNLGSSHSLSFISNSDNWTAAVVVQDSVPMYLADIIKASLKDLGFTHYIYNSKTVYLLENYEIYDKLPRYFSSAEAEPAAPEAIEFLTEVAELKKVRRAQQLSFGTPVKNPGSRTATITGQITEHETNEPLIGAVVMIEGTTRATTTDASGSFSMELPLGRYTLLVNMLGKEEGKAGISLYADGSLKMELANQTTELQGVTVTASQVHNVQGIQVGLEVMEIKTVRELPSTMGEADIVKSAIMLPGVQTVGEAASGFNVRGGSVDQNLVLLDGAPIFNTSHLFGFFSVFNQDAIGQFMLYKSGVPAQYGGRASSVLSVETNNPNRKEYTVILGVSPVTGRAYIEGPIIKDRTSFMAAGRTTYSDWILKRIDDPAISSSAGSFWDGNLKLTHSFNNKNSLRFSAYRSSDYFKLASDTAFSYSNTCGSLMSRHVLSPKATLTNTVAYSKYNYNIKSTGLPEEGFSMKYGISYYGAKASLGYQPAANHQINAGLEAERYALSPSKKNPLGEASRISKSPATEQTAMQYSAFLGDEYSVSERLLIYAGLRASVFATTSGQMVYQYIGGLPLSKSTVIDSAYNKKGSASSAHFVLEPRFSARLKLGYSNSVKASYNRMSQNLHMLSNSAAMSPTDSWTISNKYIKPQVADIFSVGYYHNMRENRFEASAEVYYKAVDNVVDFKGGADFMQSDYIETEIIQGQQEAYGLELMLKKQYGSWTGWVAYTYSRSLLTMDSKHREERINKGNPYPANHDKPHDLTIVANKRFNRRLSLASTLTYSTGRPITFPVAKYLYKDNNYIHYSDRNEYRVPDYFRIDASANIDGNLKSEKIAHSYWSVSVYNLTGRYNVYSIFFKSTNSGYVEGYQMAIFPRPILSVSYNIKF